MDICNQISPVTTAQMRATLLSKVKPDGTLLGIIQVGNLNIASLDTVVKTLVSSTPTFQSLYPSKWPWQPTRTRSQDKVRRRLRPAITRRRRMCEATLHTSSATDQTSFSHQTTPSIDLATTDGCER